MIPRLLVDQPLEAGAAAALSDAQAHYLRSVLRREAGAPLRVFNARDGEFDAALEPIGKKAAAARLGARRRQPSAEADLRLLFAPVKRTPTEYIVEKSTELGVARLAPVITARTNVDRLRVDRLQAIAVEAAEQSGRLSAPLVEDPAPLENAIAAWPAHAPLVYCDEAGDDPNAEWGGPTGRAPPLNAVIAGVDADNGVGVLIGPEGGFTPDERASLRAAPFVRPAGLGPRILRADTAALAALAVLQAVAGDWRC